LGQPLTAQAPIIEYPETDRLVILGGNSLIGSNIPFPIESRSYGILVGVERSYLRNLAGEHTLLSCIIEEESTWDLDAIGDSGKAFCILQFHQPTFNEFCIRKYGLAETPEQIHDPEIQILCYQEMANDHLVEDHWPNTYAKCLTE